MTKACTPLRHAAATAWLAAGADIVSVAAWLGDTVQMVHQKTYAHLMPDAGDRGRQAMNAFSATKDSSALDVPSDVP